MLKKLLVAAAAAGAMSVPFAGLASADANGPANPSDKITADNPAFEDSGYHSIQNIYNPALRFSTNDGRVAIPGRVPADMPDQSAVSRYPYGGSGGIVAPPSRNP